MTKKEVLTALKNSNTSMTIFDIATACNCKPVHLDRILNELYADKKIKRLPERYVIS